ncbi:hypothetical protein BC939DRAFT_159754 [Gamsiella multidivaricata]|uniref:uncharacterized protein n=1 Tax=Gamsiella multidivaricata TaxID=101098 RepID=UPI00222050D9|nr:uncharacterized protein BC939DRAFT_159754 [Gamsiella multidivaricata]KAI7823565.1 hypothetical protein BC939DRAFT_159754 [Gamsiella multidivaricata]
MLMHTLTTVSFPVVRPPSSQRPYEPSGLRRPLAIDSATDHAAHLKFDFVLSLSFLLHVPSSPFPTFSTSPHSSPRALRQVSFQSHSPPPHFHLLCSLSSAALLHTHSRQQPSSTCTLVRKSIPPLPLHHSLDRKYRGPRSFDFDLGTESLHPCVPSAI